MQHVWVLFATNEYEKVLMAEFGQVLADEL